MNGFITRIRDWKRPILQFAILIACIVGFVYFDVAGMITDILHHASIEVSSLPTCWRVAIAYGKWPICALIFLILFNRIRHWNSTEILNDSGFYHDHFYASYWFCRHILGYQKCSLRLVPVYMQFKLVINNLFPEFVYTEGIHTKDNDDIFVVLPEKYTSTVNLVIADTYSIAEGQLPDTVVGLSSIYIDRSSSDHTRYHSNALIEKTVSTVRNLPNNVVKVNVFATTNPWNTRDIALEAFSTGARDTIKHLVVYQQSSVNARNFYEPGKKIY